MRSLSWRTLWSLGEPTNLCITCTEELHTLSGTRCQKCSRESSMPTCPDCQRWEVEHDPLLFNHSVFAYNDIMQDMLARWKYRGDYIVGKAFATTFQKIFNHTFKDINKNLMITSIPLSQERLKERGFNQAQMLAELLPIKSGQFLKRVHSEKQSKKTRQERLETDNPFLQIQNVPKTIVLIDDMYTTGTTLRHAARSLHEGGAENVYAYTLVRS